MRTVKDAVLEKLGPKRAGYVQSRPVGKVALAAIRLGGMISLLDFATDREAMTKAANGR